MFHHTGIGVGVGIGVGDGDGGGGKGLQDDNPATIPLIIKMIALKYLFFLIFFLLL